MNLLTLVRTTKKRLKLYQFADAFSTLSWLFSKRSTGFLVDAFILLEPKFRPMIPWLKSGLVTVIRVPQKVKSSITLISFTSTQIKMFLSISCLLTQIYRANFQHLDYIKWDHSETFSAQLVMSGSVPHAWNQISD